LLLFYFYLTGTFWTVVRQVPHGPVAVCRELYRAVRRTARGCWIVLRFLCRRGGAAPLVPLCQEVQADPQRLFRHADFACILVRSWMSEQRYEEVVDALTPLVEPTPSRAECYGMRGLAHAELGQYQEALADLARCHELSPRTSRLRNFGHQLAFLRGLRGDVEGAREALCEQFGLATPTGTADALAGFLRRRLDPLLGNLGLRGSVGVFLGSYARAVGHAILDPFHYLNLFRDRFDHLVMVHPPPEEYTAATRLAAEMLEPHVRTVVCDDADSLSFAWQHLGELRQGDVTFLVHNYWALNRLTCKARQDPAHRLHGGRTYLRPTPGLVSRAEDLLRRHGVRLSERLVVIHCREHSYHELRGQSYRNTEARNYVPALRKLLSHGYQVVRIGDRKMTSLRGDVPGLLELPLTDYYDPILDPYLIWRCVFMISCQSGPCSYARVFGKPNLVVNAVYHHSLLPEYRELIAFKQYRNASSGEPLGVDRVFRTGGHLFDRTRHFTEHGVLLEDMTPEEIEAAVEEMLDWLRQPNRPETLAQREFRWLMNQFASGDGRNWALATPMTDYVGYALPECRVSDAVAAMRPGWLRAPTPCVLPAVAAESGPCAVVAKSG
jgi:putative glycosyltransferase (TIGR04372 family)